jgi:hypothetical protein
MPNGKPKQLESLVIEVRPPTPLPPKQGAQTQIDCQLLEISTSGKGHLKSGKIELEQGEGPFCIQLKLAGALDWDTRDPLWIEEGQCPGSSKVASQQIWVDRTANKKAVTLLNMNVGSPCELHYRMNFSDGYFCDPIMSNGGGNILSSDS